MFLFQIDESYIEITGNRSNIRNTLELRGRHERNERIIREIRRCTHIAERYPDGHSTLMLVAALLRDRKYEAGHTTLSGDGNAAQPASLRRQPLEIGSGYRRRKCARLLTQPPGLARAVHACPLVERGGSSWVARGDGGHWPLSRAAELHWLSTRRRRGIASYRSPRQWPVTGKFHGDSDRQVLAASGQIADRRSSTYSW